MRPFKLTAVLLLLVTSASALAGAPASAPTAATGLPLALKEGFYPSASREWVSLRDFADKECGKNMNAKGHAALWDNCEAFAPRYYPPSGSKCPGQLEVWGSNARLGGCDPGDYLQFALSGGTWSVVAIGAPTQSYGEE